MGLFRVIYGFLYPSGPTQTYKDKQQDLAPNPSAPEVKPTPLFRSRRTRALIFGGIRNTRRRSAALLIGVFLAAVILPFGPVCPDKSSVLQAMSNGGRVGKDAPYVPRGCDMRWHDTEEVCEILNRFSQVVLVGDSMLRHIIGALAYANVSATTNLMSRAAQSKVSIAPVTCLSMTSLASTARMEQIVRYPIPDEEVNRLKEALASYTTRPRAFVLGHGLWNNLDLHQCGAWLDSVIAPIRLSLEHRSGRTRTRTRDGQLPILLVTPNAAGERKPDEWLVTQGNKALVGFERAMAADAANRRIDHLGTWNMSIQATLYDGVHMDLRGNLVKAMMVLNWLDLLEFQ
ncbi:hypothetical protein SLS62_003435 [Diatrype stigma]|uniref:Uncharacterized protein n=1 Tax=Diatrype stigma TaxID=117547 RepID=A0AAN9UW97_9PEZI